MDAIIIGLVSDTHGLFRPAIADALAGVSLILHAGDVGADAVLASLGRSRRFAPSTATSTRPAHRSNHAWRSSWAACGST